MISEIMGKAEEAVKTRAAEIAYKCSEYYEDRQVQSNMYELCKSYIILGARMMQEEITGRIMNHEHIPPETKV